MGASFDYRTYQTEDFNKAKESFESDQDQDRYDNGNEYSGGIGMLQDVEKSIKEFPSRDKAYEYVEENAEKRGPALAVRFIIGGMTDSGKKKNKKLGDAINVAIDNRDNLRKKFALEIENQKSKTMGCKHCGSHVNKNYIKYNKCPVCAMSILSVTQQNRIATLDNKIHTAKKNFTDYKPSVKKGKIGWFIGGNCPA